MARTGKWLMNLDFRGDQTVCPRATEVGLRFRYATLPGAKARMRHAKATWRDDAVGARDCSTKRATSVTEAARPLDKVRGLRRQV